MNDYEESPSLNREVLETTMKKSEAGWYATMRARDADGAEQEFRGRFSTRALAYFWLHPEEA